MNTKTKAAKPQQLPLGYVRQRVIAALHGAQEKYRDQMVESHTKMKENVESAEKGVMERMHIARVVAAVYDYDARVKLTKEVKKDPLVREEQRRLDAFEKRHPLVTRCHRGVYVGRDIYLHQPFFDKYTQTMDEIMLGGSPVVDTLKALASGGRRSCAMRSASGVHHD